MPEPLTTDEIAAAIRDSCRKHRMMADITRGPAEGLAAMLHQRLPGVSDADMAAVLMHVGSYLTTVFDAMRRQCVSESATTTTVINVVGVAGEQIHRRVKASTNRTGARS